MSNKLFGGKKLVRPSGGKKKFYICDPEKNVSCSGRGKDQCGTVCFCTTNPKFSKDKKALTFEKMEEIENEREAGKSAN